MTILNAIVAWPKRRRVASDTTIHGWAPAVQRAVPAVLDVLVIVAAFGLDHGLQERRQRVRDQRRGAR